MSDTSDQYTLDVDHHLEQELLAELRQRIGDSQGDYSVHIITGDDPASRLARSLECRVFSEFTFDRPITEIMRDEYVPFDSHCFFIVVVSWSAHQLVGVMRIITGHHISDRLASLRQLKSLSDLENPAEPWQLDLAAVLDRSRLSAMTGQNTWDVATLAVHPDYRRKNNANIAISFSLYHQLYRMSVANKVEYWVAILDVIVLNLIQQMGRPFHHYTDVETKYYVGAPSTPVYSHIRRAAKRLRWRNYLLYRQLAKGGRLRKRTFFEEPFEL